MQKTNSTIVKQMKMSNEFPLVTVMIPTYNQELYIEEAIHSALNQTYPNLEVIVCDDCSTDNTWKRILTIKDPRLKAFHSEKNRGRVGNYHHIFYDLANGDWVINLDGDDYFLDVQFITKAINEINIASKFSKEVVAYCYKHGNLRQIQNEFSTKQISEDSIIISGKEYFLNYYKIGSFGHASTLYRRDVALEVGDMYTLPYQASDFHSIIRIFLKGDILLSSKSMAYWRIHGNNATITLVDNKQKEAMKTFDEIEKFAVSYCSKEELEVWRKEMNISSFRDYISTYIHCRRNLKALKLLIFNPYLNRSYFRLWFYFIFNR